MTIRRLTQQDAPAYRALRLKALRTNPESYLASYETETAKSVESFAWELRYATNTGVINGYYGAFIENKLIGYALLDQIQLPKQKHIAYLYNLYIDPDHRQQGYASQLFTHIAQVAKEQAQIERIFITCNRKNTGAHAVYKKLGFKEHGVKEKSVKWQGEYDDEVEMVKEL